MLRRYAVGHENLAVAKDVTLEHSAIKFFQQRLLSSMDGDPSTWRHRQVSIRNLFESGESFIRNRGMDVQSARGDESR